VEILDEGPRYRVRVTLASGRVLERVYSDPARECATRTRFASEFIVVALMPPMIADEAIRKASPNAATPAPSSVVPAPGASTSAAPAAVAPAPPGSASPGSASEAAPAQPPPAPRAPPPATPAPVAQNRESPQPESTPPRARWRWLRLEIEAVGELAPKVLGAPSVLTIGPELRARLGRGAWGAFLSVAYEPPVPARADGVALRVMRVPIGAGARVRRRFGPFEVGGDLGAALAIESYAAPQLHRTNDDVWRVAPGLQAGAQASWEAAGVLGFVAGLRCTWLPLIQDLVATPAGSVGKTPSLWLGAVLGVSFEP
jgi:hypothetical protein